MKMLRQTGPRSRLPDLERAATESSEVKPARKRQYTVPDLMSEHTVKEDVVHRFKFLSTKRKAEWLSIPRFCIKSAVQQCC